MQAHDKVSSTDTVGLAGGESAAIDSYQWGLEPSLELAGPFWLVLETGDGFVYRGS
jgi:hypothetical protein